MLFLLTTATVPCFSQPVPVLSLQIEGNTGIASTRLKSRLRFTREGGWYSPETLRAELRELADYYRDNGYLQARIGEPQVELKTLEGRGQGVLIRIPVEEGPVYALGSLTLLNAKVFAVETLLQMAPLSSGQPYSREKLRDWLSRIRDSYSEMGYIRFDTEIKEAIHELTRTVDCTVEFSEGASYRVRHITVLGDGIDPAEFKKQLLVGEGGVYNPQMLAYSLQFLNLRRTYRPFGPSDVEIRIDDEAQTVDLMFRVVLLDRQKRPPLLPPMASPSPRHQRNQRLKVLDGLRGTEAQGWGLMAVTNPEELPDGLSCIGLRLLRIKCFCNAC